MSDYIIWTPAMSVESEVLDGHHRMIVDCLNALHPLVGRPDQQGEVHEVVDRLEHFVLVHFSEEERLMIDAGFPGWQGHKQLHDKMYDVVFDLKSDVEQGKLVDAERLFEMLNTWLVQHILGADREYVPYLSSPERPKADVWTSDHRNRH